MEDPKIRLKHRMELKTTKAGSTIFSNLIKVVMILLK
ncbi:unnamed protein product [Rhodiola kirilowii]